ILKGYAGTGKTTLMHFLVKHLVEQKREYKLLAPTGRAAKVLSDMAAENRFEGEGGRTIHSLIYRYAGFNRELKKEELESAHASGQLCLNFSFDPLDLTRGAIPTVYIVDESSMIGNTQGQPSNQAYFGSGKLLDELMQYDQLPGSKFIFVGDPCQLPPVGDIVSPAMEEMSFKPAAHSEQLTEIVRQRGSNDIIRLSKEIRKKIANAPDAETAYGGMRCWTKLPFRRSPNVALHSNLEDMVGCYVRQIKANGYNKSTFVCQTNKQATELSAKVRRMLGLGGNLPMKGDLMMVIQNNGPSGLVNGDLVEVMEVSPLVKQRAMLSFVKVKVKECVSDREFSSLLLLDTLNANVLNLTMNQQSELFIEFCCRMNKQGIKPKPGNPQFDEALQKDPYLNALRCMYGYAITCHKAQGGEWDEVYLHVMRNIGLNPTKQVYRWLYTAITRAKQTLHMVDDRLYLE
ncbi:MAG: AAA family ATPase, partial [Bacteroidales bacterium]|nr:AAA family ATPase [Bacteroidales bacterium]